MISQFFEIGDNKIALTVTFILLLLVLLLVISIFSKKVENLLHTMRILEGKESPKELLTYIVLIVVCIRVIHILLIQPFIVDGDSMYPQLHSGDVLLVDKVIYRYDHPQVGDIIVFKYHDPYHKCIDKSVSILNMSSDAAANACNKESRDPYDDKYLVKRIVSGPNSSVSYDGREYVTGVDQYIVMGDNRPDSYDSRAWGPLDARYISGRVFVRILPLSAIDWNPAPMKNALNLVK